MHQGARSALLLGYYISQVQVLLKTPEHRQHVSNQHPLRERKRPPRQRAHMILRIRNKHI